MNFQLFNYYPFRVVKFKKNYSFLTAMNKKGAWLEALVIIIIVLAFAGWLINESWKECRSDSDCKSGQYCSSRFECRDIPKIVEKASPIMSTQSALILSVAIIVAAIILKLGNPFKKEKKIEEKHHKEEKPHKETKEEKYNAEEEGLYDDTLDEEF